VQVIGVNGTDKLDQVKKDLKSRPTPYPHVIGRGTSIMRDYKVPMMPYLYFIDRKGRIDSSTMFLQYDDIKEIIDYLINSLKKNND